jgi:prenyltransferase beta subunit
MKSRKGIAALLAALLVLVTAGAASAAQANTEEAGRALAWMRTQQQADGSFAGFGAGSTVDAVLAIVAAGGDPASFSNGGKSAVEFLESKAAELAKTPGAAGKLLIAVAATGRDGRSFGGVNVVDAVNGSYNPAKGQYGADAIGHAFAMLGLKAVSAPVPQEAAAFLESVQTPEGGWAFSGDPAAGGADTNTTAVAVQALQAAGVEPGGSQVIEKALGFLRSQQGADGGFPYQKGGEFGDESDVNSTAYVVQALHSVGEHSAAAGGEQYLLSMQKANGAFRWKQSEADDNPGATYQAVPALVGATLVNPWGAAAQSGVSAGGSEPGPGMPRTGGGMPSAAAAALALLSALALAGGLAARRLQPVR